MPVSDKAMVDRARKAGHSKLGLAKLVEMRKRSRIDRARQLASNIETQAQILRSMQLYNLEAARLQLDKQLGGMGADVPQAARAVHDARVATMSEEAKAARAVHDARLAALTAEVADLRQQQRDSVEIVSVTHPSKGIVRDVHDAAKTMKLWKEARKGLSVLGMTGPLKTAEAEYKRLRGGVQVKREDVVRVKKEGA